MDSLNSMVSKLSATGIYSLNEDSNVYSELKAYAEGLDVLVSELEVMLRECFFSTAEDYGLERAERLWGNVHNDMDTEKRRQMLLARSSFGAGDFTLEGTEKLMKILGISGAVFEYPALQRISVDVSDDDYSEGQRIWIISQLRALLPAHLDVDVVFSGLDWNQVDSKNLTFEEMENRALTWEEIDLL